MEPDTRNNVLVETAKEEPIRSKSAEESGVLTENPATATLAVSARRSGRAAECAGLENR